MKWRLKEICTSALVCCNAQAGSMLEKAKAIRTALVATVVNRFCLLCELATIKSDTQ